MKKDIIELSDKEFELFQKLVFSEIGVFLGNSKKHLVKNRLLKQLIKYELNSYSDYFRLIQVKKSEKTVMLNLITTNETYFFREYSHFEFLQEYIISKQKNNNIRVWSAASSVGAEAYSVAMMFDNENLNFEIVGSDINTEVVKKANVGLYPIKWMDKIPDELKFKYCLKGKGSHEGWFLVDRCLLKYMKFQQRNLIEEQGDLGLFDVIFLRNVLIYFDDETKEKIVKNVLKNLKRGGYLIISLTEHIYNLDKYGLQKVQSSIFQKVSR
ncbi:MAG: CheR family methyltransferase [Halarcobacter sp.]